MPRRLEDEARTWLTILLSVAVGCVIAGLTL